MQKAGQSVHWNRPTCFFVNTMATPSFSTPDEKLRAAILSRFAADERMASVNLRVGVLNGIVHLAGVVNSIEMRILAAELAEAVEGVRGVVNRIEAPGAPSPSRTVHLSPILKEKTTNNDEIPE
jgi:hypothetical protein